jgi:hypothetical protein
MLVQPMMAVRVRESSPRTRRAVAAEWRRSWMRSRRSPAAARSWWKSSRSLVQRPSGGVGDHEVLLVPAWPGGVAFGRLPCAVLAQFGGDRFRQGDGASPGGRFRRSEVRSAAARAWASGGAPSARRLCVVRGAAVLPGQPGQGVADGELAGVGVDVGPAPGQGFALAQAEQGQAPAHTVTPLLCGAADLTNSLTSARTAGTSVFTFRTWPTPAAGYRLGRKIRLGRRFGGDGASR